MAISIRGCTDADVPGVVALVEDRIGEEDAPEARLVLDDPTYDCSRCSVAMENDRVVSTMGKYPMTARFGRAAGGPLASDSHHSDSWHA